MKMLLYLFCQLVDMIESEQCQADPLTGGKQKGKKKVTFRIFKIEPKMRYPWAHT